MRHRKIDECELLFHKALPSLYNFFSGVKFNIEYEFLIPGHNTLIHGGSQYRIPRVAGCFYPEGLGSYVLSLFDKDFESYRAKLLHFKKESQSQYISGIIEQIKELRSTLITKSVYDGVQFNRFAHYELSGLNLDYVLREQRNLVLLCAEPYVDALDQAINDITSILNQVKYTPDVHAGSNISSTHLKINRQSFHYVNYSPVRGSEGYKRLENFFERLLEKKYLHPGTKDAHFFKAFSGGPINQYIIWIKGKGDFRYFIQTLVSNEKVDNTKELLHWKFACDSFKYRDGTNFTRDSLRWGKIPQNSESLVLLKSLIEAL